ncbi:hypothetical protein, partial [Paraburkholderia terricola]|uniref:hypothetical protein n=1 Tax=Paraburkholderia terricola TaxID=169427 RepID=UPI00286CF9DD
MDDRTTQLPAVEPLTVRLAAVGRVGKFEVRPRPPPFGLTAFFRVRRLTALQKSGDVAFDPRSYAAVTDTGEDLH